MIATYDLRDKSPSYEFFFWLALVVARGATEIVIDPRTPKLKNMTPDMVIVRLHNILLPGAALAGLSSRIGHDKTQVQGSMQEFLPWVLAGGKFERLRSVKNAISCRYTVTLRKQKVATWRNSNEMAWRQFAEEIGALVIEEYAVRPIDLHDRMALYAGAQMNFGVCNGPIAMLSLTPYPVMQFVPNFSARNSQVKSGIPLESARFPWMLPSQRLVWKDDTIENLRETFHDLAMQN
jgi:hypothetical protein